MSKRETPYRPIPCADYSRYECAIVQQRSLRLAWHDEQDLLQLHHVRPLDLFTREHAEFLVLADEQDHQHQVRLDFICYCSIDGEQD